MKTRVLALGLDPAFADFTAMPGLTPELVRAYIDTELDKIRELGCELTSCLVDTGDTVDALVGALLHARRFDCVLFGAGLRDARHLLLFERLVNLVHALAPQARLCFNTNPADSAEAVQRWI